MNELAWGVMLAGFAIGFGLYRIGFALTEISEVWASKGRRDYDE